MTLMMMMMKLMMKLEVDFPAKGHNCHEMTQNGRSWCGFLEGTRETERAEERETGDGDYKQHKLVAMTGLTETRARKKEKDPEWSETLRKAHSFSQFFCGTVGPLLGECACVPVISLH